MSSVTVPRGSAGSCRTQTQIRYTHIGAVYCNKMVLADEPSAIAEMNSAFISAKHNPVSHKAGRNVNSWRRTIGKKTAAAKTTRQKAIDSGSTVGWFSPRPVFSRRTLVKAPLVLHNSAARTTQRRACVGESIRYPAAGALL